MDGIIYVFDSSDRFRLSVVAHELDLLVNNKDHPIPNIPILIYANKADLIDKISVNDLSNSMQLSSLLGKKIWSMYPSSTVTGMGITEGFEWITK